MSRPHRRVPTPFARHLVHGTTLAALLVGGTARATCPEPDAVLDCATVLDDRVDGGPWIGADAPDLGDAGWLNQQLYDNDLGDTCYWWPAPPALDDVAWVCDAASDYACGGEPAPQEGPERIYRFDCPADGTITVRLEGQDCDLDLYALAGGCDPATDCQAEVVGYAGPDDTLVVDCEAGAERTLVVEGHGLTVDAWETYVAGPLARGDEPSEGSCHPELGGLYGHFTISVDPASDACRERCSGGVDEDADGLTDCADPDCVGDLACAPPEACDSGADDDRDGLTDCADPDCWDAEHCCDDDADGFLDPACGGRDCDDRVVSVDGDGDGVPDACDACAGHPDDADRDGDGLADGCDACPDAPAIDADGDGASDCEDCDDADPYRSPLDLDGDGYTSCDDDCDDGDPTRHPGAPERADGVDQDCDGLIDEGTAWSDDDGDGFSEAGGDCDDARADAHPAADERCDGTDTDCDGEVDEGTECTDDDGDGHSELDGDCHDGDVRIGPHVLEIPYNGIDDDCDGVTDDDVVDTDGDGFTAEGGDCGPHDPHTHPAATERPDGIDNDCDGTVDEGTVAYDDDGDGFSERDGDCHDGDPEVAPGLPDDDGDGVDDDCDGHVDEDVVDPPLPLSETDADGDGAFADVDCDDDDGWVHPGAHEFCDAIDNDCDGIADEGCRERPVRLVTGGCATAPGGGPAWLALLALLARRR